MKKARIFLFLIIIIISLFLYVSCDNTENGENDLTQDTNDENTTDESTSTSDKDTLIVVNFSGDPVALDPLHAFDPDSYSVISSIFDPLVYLDYDANLVPGLATEWEVLNPTTIQFKLRKGVKFHNGEDFDAEVVKFSFDTQLDPATKSPTGQQILSTIKEVQIIDKYTVNIVTLFPDGMFLHRMHMFGSIIPKKYIEENGIDALYTHPIGTGAFKFVKWDKGQQIVLEANENYWKKGLPKIKNLIFKILPEKEWLNALLKGDVDFVMHMSGEHKNTIEKYSKTKSMERMVLSSYWFLMKNKGVLADIRVRKALNYAVNKENLIKYGDYGNGRISASVGCMGEFGFNENTEPYSYDLEKAKELLKEAGYENGFKLKVLASDAVERIAKLVQEDLAKINVEFEIKVVPRAEWPLHIPSAAILHGKKDILEWDIIATISDNPLANLTFESFVLCHSTGVFSNMNDPIFDNKWMWALSTSNYEEHEKRLKELDKLIHDNAYLIFTYQRILTPGLRQNVNIKKININGHLDYKMLEEATKG